MSKHLVVANWKMAPKTPKEALNLFTTTKEAVARLRSVEVVIAAPALYIPLLTQGYGGNKISFAAQTFSVHEGGAHTGSLSAAHFAASGVRYALIGHSETRVDECMDSDALRVKTFLALKHNLTPIVFIGERERDASGNYLKHIETEILTTLTELSASRVSEVVFCYEPVWTIGGDDAMDSYDIHQMTLFVRKVLLEHYGGAAAQQTRVLYGGSVNAENISEILSIGDIDGVVSGRASTDAEQFTGLLKCANTA